MKFYGRTEELETLSNQLPLLDNGSRLVVVTGRRLTMAEKIEYPVRKAAHMTEYAILGLLSFTFYRGILKKEKRQFLAALLTAAVYAATDEFHQYFIPGRSAEVMDVCIDTLGASIGLAILFFTLKVVRKHCQKSKLTLQ